MAFMAMKKNLDERARKKGFDEIFDKFDRNKNGLYTIQSTDMAVACRIYIAISGGHFSRNNVCQRLCEGVEKTRH